jgi:spore germination protein
MKNKTWKIWTIVLAVAFFVAAMWGYNQYLGQRQVAALLENEYQRSFYSLTDSVENLQFLTGKLQIAGKEQSLYLLAQIQSEADKAQADLCSLPLEANSLNRTSTYFNQLSDYAKTLAKKVTGGQELSVGEKAQITSFYRELSDIYDQLSSLEQATASGSVRFIMAEKTGNNNRAVQVTADNVEAEPVTAANYFSKLEASLGSIKTLSYEGAYSAHMANIKAKNLLAGKSITKDEARKIAEQFFKAKNYSGYQYQNLVELSEAAIPVYYLTFSNKDKNANISISKVEGKIIGFMIDKEMTSAAIKVEEAVQKAQDFIKNMDYPNMKAIAQSKEDERLLVTLARLEDDILYYPDKVLVEVALDDGAIVAFQAEDYWLNYGKRDLPELQVTAEDAQGKLNKAFVMKQNSLALVSDGAGGELLCHEFLGTCGEDEYVVQVDSQGGLEQNIFRNVSGDDGFYSR